MTPMPRSSIVLSPDAQGRVVRALLGAINCSLIEVLMKGLFRRLMRELLVADSGTIWDKWPTKAQGRKEHDESKRLVGAFRRLCVLERGNGHDCA